MSCEDARGLLHAYVDGELDLVRSLEIEKHLESCKTCAQTVQNQQTLSSAMRSSSFYFRPPRELKPRIDAALRRSERKVPWSMLALAAALLIAGVFVDRLVQFGSGSNSANLVAQEVLDSHLRSAFHRIKPAADQRETLFGEVGDWRREIQLAVEPRLHRVTVGRLNIRKVAGHQ